ncbi:putative nudix domain protein [Rosellinia necatrix]|uniref:Putative nudix domain protein n=1 Tax=Rosellinia necatrix TaxID=77044 RepID=A0A1W2TKM3_ROSNE|nr:putative nudix domain protein [Rosellinia necatrix]
MASAPPVTATTTAAPTTTATPSPDSAPTLFTFDSSVAAFQVPLGAYLKATPPLQGVCVGAFVFDNAGRLLVVQRAPHDSYPLRWEVPGGTIDAEDESILHGLARELWEETGLRARRVLGPVGRGYTFLTRRPLCVCKYSFLVDVEAHDVTLDPNEHAAALWVTEQEATAGRCGDVELAYTSENQENAIRESFKTRRIEEEAGA